jgi:hypothetical protein
MELFFENSRIICEIQYWFLDIDLGDALFFFIGFQKCIVIEMWHHFTDAFFTFFFIGF